MTVERRLLRLGSVLSLTLGVAAVLLCCRSCVLTDEVHYTRANPHSASNSVVVLTSARGTFALAVIHRPGSSTLPANPSGKPRAEWSHSAQKAETFVLWDAVAAMSMASQGGGSSSVRSWNLRFPQWPLIAVTALLPAIQQTAERRRPRRLEQLRCIHCGYDLRATPEKCPECGNVVGQPTRVSS